VTFVAIGVSVEFEGEGGEGIPTSGPAGRPRPVLAPPFGLEAGPTAPNHFVGVVVRVASRREILCEQFGGSHRQRRALGLTVGYHRFDALGIQNASERRANTS